MAKFVIIGDSIAHMTTAEMLAVSLGSIPMTDPIRTLRDATEDDVAKALEDSYVSTPLSEPAALLEFFNRMIDVRLGEGVGTDE